MYTNTQGIILAAGKSTRFNTGKTTIFEKRCEQERILYVTKLLAHCNIPTIIVVGHQKNDLLACISKHHENSIQYITQDEQRGTGHALRCTEQNWHATDLLVLNGDIPLITDDIIQQLYAKHRATDAAISFVTAHKPDFINCSYGRVLQDGRRITIVEAADMTEQSDDYAHINAGIYIIKKDFLQHHITQLNRNNAKNELYITDLINIASNNGLTV